MTQHLVHIGTQKAGSSFLHGLLAQIPAIGAANRQELNFFLRKAETAGSDYEAWFPAGAGIQFENSPVYFRRGEVVAEPMARAFGDSPLLISLILRDPVSYLKSHHKMRLRQGSFGREDQADDLLDYCMRNPGYIDRCRYASILESQWFKRFKPEQFEIFFFEEFVADPISVVRRLCMRLGIECPELDQSQVFNNAEPRWQFVQKARLVVRDTPPLRRFARAFPALRRTLIDVGFKTRPKARLEQGGDEDRIDDYLVEQLASDMERLRQIVGRPLPWRRFAQSAQVREEGLFA